MGVEGRLLIVRFAPFSAQGCRANARGTYDSDLEQGLRGRYGVSVRGVMVSDGESPDEAIIRLRASTPLRGKDIASVWADVLGEAGFRVVPDMPPDMHYLVGQDDMVRMPDCDALALVWSSTRRRCPTWRRGKEDD